MVDQLQTAPFQPLISDPFLNAFPLDPNASENVVHSLLTPTLQESKVYSHPLKPPGQPGEKLNVTSGAIPAIPFGQAPVQTPLAPAAASQALPPGVQKQTGVLLKPFVFLYDWFEKKI